MLYLEGIRYLRLSLIVYFTLKDFHIILWPLKHQISWSKTWHASAAHETWLHAKTVITVELLWAATLLSSHSSFPATSQYNYIPISLMEWSDLLSGHSSFTGTLQPNYRWPFKRSSVLIIIVWYTYHALASVHDKDLDPISPPWSKNNTIHCDFGKSVHK